MFCYVDENHSTNRFTAELVANIVYNHEFQQLHKELEKIYRNIDKEKSAKKAFEDALYSFLAQEDKYSTRKAY